MTVEVRTQRSESSTLRGGVQGSYFGSPDQEWLVSTVMQQLTEAPWRQQILKQLIGMSEEYPVSGETLNTALRWILDLAPSMPRPTIGAGDDGTISIEWEKRANVLHVMFEGPDADVYFAGANGDEWETNLVHGSDKIDVAMRLIAFGR